MPGYPFYQSRGYERRHEPSNPTLPDRFVVLDTETTGLDPSSERIVEIAILTYRDGSLFETYETLINPGKRMPAMASAVNGITDDMLIGAPAFPEVAAMIQERIDGVLIVGYNIDFDLRFLNASFARAGRIVDLAKKLDVLAVARQALPYGTLPNHRLETLKRHFGITRGSHRAADDCLTTYEILLRCRKNADATHSRGDGPND
ncbi:MAG TPA: hypothetical protein DCR44_03810 [Acholeplasmatales bacterium]|nr:MAG: hypothetical protein A2Y16_01455 [Tenericutes bacterium GWF2_57_13]HAQ56509.1 hypothetical protein [Acholeplasmatales bacterium]